MVSGGFQILVNYSFIFLYQFGFDMLPLILKIFFLIAVLMLYQLAYKIVTLFLIFF